MTGEGRKRRRQSLLRDTTGVMEASHTWNESMTIRRRRCTFCWEFLTVGETPDSVILSRSAEKHLKEKHSWPNTSPSAR